MVCTKGSYCFWRFLGCFVTVFACFLAGKVEISLIRYRITDNPMMNQEWKHTRRIIAVGLVSIIAVIAVLGALSLLIGISRPTGVGYYPFRFFGFGWIGAIFAFLFIFWIGRWIFWGWGWHSSRRYWGYQDQSYYIIRERYARGEITKDQYDQMMRDLHQHA